MPRPRFSIGIDLGTTNCAMASVALDDALAESVVFTIPQWEAIDRLAEATTLPSFLYLPTSTEADQLQGAGRSDKAEWLVGRIARRRAAEVPGRVAHSAKSWLGHHAVDRDAPFLPWGSDEIPAGRKISPLHASALLLNYLRGAWDSRFAAQGPDWRFDAQDITVTVPASFDAAAQELTLQAAAKAGFPASVRLIEEPQAAFYRWLEAHRDPQALWKQLPAGRAAHHVLVVDIGGGTSDFSLFEIQRHDGSAEPRIRRVAVSDHLLLGGDNIDLALAHLLEPRLAGAGETLAGTQWQDLVARCRDLKEQCLAGVGDPDEEFTISLPARGSGLFAGTLNARVTRREVMAVLFDGFYPECAADARPAQADAALKEWGLPFAADSGITRYLAQFLHGQPAVDAVLFNGGSLFPTALRERLQNRIGRWQQTTPPSILENPEPDLAVARGAARYGSILHHRSARIEAGAARSIYLEVHQAGKPMLLCLLPKGAEPGHAHEISNHPLELRLNRPVRFQGCDAGRQDAPGALVPFKEGVFHRLPPLQSTARLTPGTAAPDGNRIAVKLAASLTELGGLKLECVSTDPAIRQSWPLSFSLRPDETGAFGGAVAGESDPGVDPAALAAAKDRLVSIFSRHSQRADPLTAARLLKEFEETLGLAKADWNLMLIRSLWTALKRCIPCRANSPEHEEAWLILAGFFLRPGFGAELDPSRIDDLWESQAGGLLHPGKALQLQQAILWRRVAGGLNRERQQSLADAALARLQSQKKPPAELVRMVGALERIDPATKLAFARLFIDQAAALAGSGGYAAPHFVALGLLLNRTPLYTGPDAVLPPDLVASAFDAFEELDWKQPELAELFLRAARVTDHRNADVPKPLRRDIVRKLEKAGQPPHKTIRVEQFIPVDRAEKSGLYGESLPPGLILAKA